MHRGIKHVGKIPSRSKHFSSKLRELERILSSCLQAGNPEDVPDRWNKLALKLKGLTKNQTKDNEDS